MTDTFCVCNNEKNSINLIKRRNTKYTKARSPKNKLNSSQDCTKYILGTTASKSFCKMLLIPYFSGDILFVQCMKIDCLRKYDL